MKEILIVGWLLALAFFAWEFTIAGGSWHDRVARIRPRTIRLIDLVFGVLIVLQLIYLFTT